MKHNMPLMRSFGSLKNLGSQNGGTFGLKHSKEQVKEIKRFLLKSPVSFDLCL
jgi:hypothetical protein